MGKKVLITGAAGNLGKATVEKFASEGYDVIAVVSPGKTLGYPVKGSHDVVNADLSREGDAAELIKTVIARHGTIDATLLLAGGFAMGNIAATDGESLKKMFTVNFETAYFTARPVFNQMLSQATGGRIVLVGARAGLHAKDGKGAVAYALSKSLIFSLAGLLNADGASKNVVTSVIVPSTIDTPVNRQAMPDADFSKWVSPQALADTMAFICSSEAAALREPVFKVYGNA